MLISVSSFRSLIRRDLASVTGGHKARDYQNRKIAGAAMIPSNGARNKRSDEVVLS